MDIMSAASSLQEHLVAHQKCENTLTVLENLRQKMIERHVTSLGGHSMLSAVEDNLSKHLRLLLRLSVNDGVLHMYKQYADRKWAQVQCTAQAIKTALEAGDSEVSTSSMTSSAVDVNPSSDKAADVWTSVYCELTRHD